MLSVTNPSERHQKNHTNVVFKLLLETEGDGIVNLLQLVLVEK